MAELEVNLLELTHRLLSFPVDEYYSHAVLSPEECIFVCHMAIGKLSETEVCLLVRTPINVVGDIHGQFHDLLRIFDSLGQPPGTRYIFLGDYIDRGKYSLEVIVLLLSMMLLYPGSVYLLRGNHEAANVCLRYGFKNEVLMRFGAETGPRVFHGFLRCFQWLPMAAIINEQILCCHGGLSPSFELPPFAQSDQAACVRHLNALIRRPVEPPQFGVPCDLLWADPVLNNPAVQLHLFPGQKTASRIKWMPSKRGCSFAFSQEALDAIMANFNVQMVVRGHQVANEGFMAGLSRRCITLFSAPGYSGIHQNNGAVLQLFFKPFNEKVNVRKVGNFFVLPYIPNRPLSSLFF